MQQLLEQSHRMDDTLQRRLSYATDESSPSPQDAVTTASFAIDAVRYAYRILRTVFASNCPMNRVPEPPAKSIPKRPINRVQTPLHPRNRHQGRYDFARLTAQCPELSPFLTFTPVGDTTIDFSNPDAVRALNRALLNVDYGVAHHR